MTDKAQQPEEDWLYFDRTDGTGVLECAHCGATATYSSYLLAIANTPDEPHCQPPKVDKLAGFKLSPEGARLAAADLAKSQKKIDQTAGMYQSSFSADPLNKNRKWQI